MNGRGVQRVLGSVLALALLAALPVDGAAAAPPARPSPGCGHAAVKAGVSTRQLAVGSTIRSYRRFVPRSSRRDRPLPLVIDLHGLTWRASMEARLTGFESLAAKRGAVVVTPQAIGTTPDGAPRAWDTFGTTDLAFLEQIMDSVGTELCIDIARIFMAGYSRGGIMTGVALCTLADRIAAVGFVDGIGFVDGCNPARAVPLMVFWGKLDLVLPFDVWARYVDTWASLDSCEVAPVTTRVSSHVEQRTYSACAGGAAVVFYVIDDGGHTWPGGHVEQAFAGDSQAITRIRSITTREISATRLLWDFWMQHRLAPSSGG